MSEHEPTPPVLFPSCTVVGETEKAVKVRGIRGRGDIWLPKKAIDDCSEVWSLRSKGNDMNPGPGTLALAAWFCEKEKLG